MSCLLQELRYSVFTVSWLKYEIKFFNKQTDEDALYFKITINFTEIKNKKYLQFLYNKEHLDLTYQENIFFIIKKRL